MAAAKKAAAKSAAKKAAVKPADVKEPKLGAAAPTPTPVTPEDEQAAAELALGAELGVAPAGSIAPKPIVPVQETVVNAEGEEKKAKSITPTGKFEAVGNEIYSELGVLVGVESANGDLSGEQMAARKADRFNSLRKLPAAAPKRSM